MSMARFRNSNRKLKHIVRSPNMLRKILVPLKQAVRQAITLEKELKLTGALEPHG